MRRVLALATVICAFLAACDSDDSPTSPDLRPQVARVESGPAGMNVLVEGGVTDAALAELSRYGNVVARMDAIGAVLMVGSPSDLRAIRRLPFVAAANLDAERSAGPPVPPVPLSDFTAGLSTWDLDALDVTQLGAGRTIAQDGEGVYVAVLDTGLHESWRFYFPDERIAEEYGRTFFGGPGGPGNVTSPPDKWQRSTNGHGTHVTSTILGYNLGGTPINGVAPRATIIPVQVLHDNFNGSGWSSMIAQGIVYVTDLARGPLAGSPVVINMSLGGSVLDAVEKAAIDYAVANGVIIVASAGNAGAEGMGFPGAYEPVISVGAIGWANEWVGGNSWWVAGDVADPTDVSSFYVTDFSSRELAGQDLDVLAPGSWVVGPYQVDQGHLSYFFLGGTSMASPHVAGVVALMLQANPSLDAADAEAALESTALPVAPGSLSVLAGPGGPSIELTWAADATGSGLVSAPAAVAGVGAQQPARPKRGKH